MRMFQYAGRLARPAGIGQGLAITGKHLHIAREFDRQPLQNRDGLRIFGHAAQGPRVIQRDRFVVRVAVVLAAPFLRAPPHIGFGCATDRTGDILRAARLAAAEPKAGRQNRPAHGAERGVPSGREVFDEIRHANASRPDSLVCLEHDQRLTLSLAYVPPPRL
jgi:hypothetical protein